MIAAFFLVLQEFVLPAVLSPPFPTAQASAPLPTFGRDTVLVYKSSLETNNVFVVRVAEFAPDRRVEWEDAITQGTIFMPSKIVIDARAFSGWELFQGGVDTRGKNSTTLWLSQRIFRDLRQKDKVKFTIDGLATWVTVLGNDKMTIDVNRAATIVPVIKTKDERGVERWFLDAEDNPLMVNLRVRDYQEKLESITTDRPNTLRWLKKK